MQLPVRKFFQVMIGTTLLGGGISLNFLGNLGLGPWGAFHDGLSKITGISYGTAIILTGIFVTLLWIPLKQKPGIGTIVDVFWTGIVVDYFIKIGSTPELLLVKILFIFFGVTLIGAGTAIYVGSNLGSGPSNCSNFRLDNGGNGGLCISIYCFIYWPCSADSYALCRP